jgi:hypothetical protein
MMIDFVSVEFFLIDHLWVVIGLCLCRRRHHHGYHRRQSFSCCCFP